jgi:magnesium transporter
MIPVRLSVGPAGNAARVDSDEALRALLATPDALVWIDVDRAHIEDLLPYADVIHLHPLAIEDAISPLQRPIFNRYGDTFFLVLNELLGNGATVRWSPIGIFVGATYVVTVREAGHSTLDDVAKRWQDSVGEVRNASAGLLLFAIVDAIVDEYFPIVETLGDRIEALEDDVLNVTTLTPQRDIHELRKQLFAIRRALAPGREVMNELIRRDMPVIDEHVMLYFHDVYDHQLRVLDWLDGYRDMVATLVEVQLAISSHRLDQVMRTLTVASIMLMVPTLIAGIYGMNFAHMPELAWYFGYPLALGMMLVSAIILYTLFRRRNWL